MDYREGKETDLESIEDFVCSSMYPAFDHPDLTEEQREENQRIIQISRKSCLDALNHKKKLLMVSLNNNELAGFIIMNKSSIDHPELD